MFSRNAFQPLMCQRRVRWSMPENSGQDAAFCCNIRAMFAKAIPAAVNSLALLRENAKLVYALQAMRRCLSGRRGSVSGIRRIDRQPVGPDDRLRDKGI